MRLQINLEYMSFVFSGKECEIVEGHSSMMQGVDMCRWRALFRFECEISIDFRGICRLSCDGRVVDCHG